MATPSLRQRPTKQLSMSDNSHTINPTSSDDDDDDVPSKPLRNPSPNSISQSTLSQALTGTANLANLLPTGTFLAFQFLIPIFTTNGVCDTVTRPLTIFLLVVLSLSCFLACFTDSVRASNGQVYYGLVTYKGLWLFDYSGVSSELPDLSKYRMKLIDGIHAVLSVMVFGALGLRDKNVLGCFYPKPEHEIQEVLDIVPVGVGLICSLLFLVFPTTRHGIGYPVTSK